MRGPDRIGVFQDWSYHGIITFQFDLSWAGLRFLCRNALTDRALDVMLVICVDQDKSLVIVKYLVDETSVIKMSLMVQLYVIGLCLRVISMNTLYQD